MADSTSDGAYTMLAVHPIMTACSGYGPPTRSKDDSLSLFRRDHLCERLRTRPLLHQHEFSTFKVVTGLVQQENSLHGKINFSVEVLMQAVVTATLIAKQKRRWPFLTSRMAHLDKLAVAGRISNVQMQLLRPFIRDLGQMGIQGFAQLLYQLGQRIRKILIFTHSKTMPCHDYLAAKCSFISVESAQAAALLECKHRAGVGPSVVAQRFIHLRPAERGDSLRNAIASGRMNLCC